MPGECDDDYNAECDEYIQIYSIQIFIHTFVHTSGCVASQVPGEFDDDYNGDSGYQEGNHCTLFDA